VKTRATVDFFSLKSELGGCTHSSHDGTYKYIALPININFWQKDVNIYACCCALMKTQ